VDLDFYLDYEDLIFYFYLFTVDLNKSSNYSVGYLTVVTPWFYYFLIYFAILYGSNCGKCLTLLDIFLGDWFWNAY
jgi:hypothetical protein